jgi:GntR family transcriptional regulator/MocR family aminotransferase
VVEDDYDTEYRYVDRPIEPLQRLDPQRVVYIGSFSKTISPSLRLGFVVGPPDLTDALLATRADVETQPPYLTQATLGAFITSGELDRHLRRTRRAYRARRHHLLGRLADLVARGVIVDHDPCRAGLHVTVRLSDDVVISSLVERLAQNGVAVNTTSQSWLGEVGPLLELGFGLADQAELDTGLEALARAVRTARATGSR